MKLIYFSQQTLPKQMGGGKNPKVSFGKGGTIHFNGAASALMDLKPGDKLTLSQDEDDSACWYFFKDPQHGFELRNGYDKKGTLFNHATMVKTFLDAFSLPTDTSHSFKIGGEPTVMKGDKTKYWGVIVPIS